MKATYKLLLGSMIIFVILNFIIFPFKGKNKTDKDSTHFYWVQEQTFQIKEETEYTPFKQSFYYGTDTCNLYTFKEKFKKPILVFYFTIEACHPCLDAIITAIRDTFTDYQTNKNIVLLSDDLETRFRNSYWDKKVINVKSDNIILPFIKKKIPTLFMIDPQTSMIHNVFPYNKITPSYLSNYLHIIKKRFFST